MRTELTAFLRKEEPATVRCDRLFVNSTDEFFAVRIGNETNPDAVKLYGGRTEILALCNELSAAVSEAVPKHCSICRREHGSEVTHAAE